MILCGIDHDSAANISRENCNICLRQRIEELEALIDRVISWDDEEPSTAAGYKSIIADMRKSREGRE